DLHCRAIFFRLLGQFPRRERRAGQTIATSFGADIENGISDAACSAARELIVSQHAQTKNIYQRIALKAFVEINFAADGGNARAISVMRDSGNDASEEAAIGCDIWTVASDRAEPERVQTQLWPSAHR